MYLLKVCLEFGLAVRWSMSITLRDGGIDSIYMFLVLIPWPSNISGRYGGNTELVNLHLNQVTRNQRIG